jgi:histidinol dehydrogenase
VWSPRIHAEGSDFVGIKRFDVGSWLDSPLSRRRLDLSNFASERATVAEICARVAVEGDAALRELGRRFDGWSPEGGDSFEVPARAMADAADRLPAGDRGALEFAAQRIRDFHARQAQPATIGLPGLKLVTRPVRRAGAYVPGGRAAYPSTLLMTVIPARVAKVREVVVATPPRADGSVPSVILAAAHIAGADAVYRVGGAQAIAAMAYGTASIPRVDVVAGPGNIHVTLAKREVFGAVGVDGIAGPTEVVVVADADARPDFIAADLAAQLEHDPLAWAVLVTDSSRLADRVEGELESLVRGLEREKIIRAATCCVIVADDLEQAMSIANDFAPEHLLIVATDAGRLASQVENAGAVFVGPYATVPLGDYAAGPNHTLPTAGAARFASPLGVHTFLKRTSVLSLNRGDLEILREASVRLANMEGLGAHAHAIEVRLE